MARLKYGGDFDRHGASPTAKGLWEWWVTAGILGAIFIVSAIFYIWLYVQQVKSSYRLSKLYAEYEQLLIVERKLRLEWARFQDPLLLEELGRNQFKLAPPRQEQKMLIR